MDNIMYCDECEGYTECLTYKVETSDNATLEVNECLLCESVYMD